MEYYDSNDSQYNQPSAGNQNGPSVNRPNTMAVVSMICGIIGTVLLCCCILFPISILLGVAAVVLAILSKKGQPFSGYAIAGLILGILCTILGVAEFAYLMFASMILRDPEFAPIFDQIMEQYQNAMPTQ